MVLNSNLKNYREYFGKLAVFLRFGLRLDLDIYLLVLEFISTNNF